MNPKLQYVNVLSAMAMAGALAVTLSGCGGGGDTPAVTPAPSIPASPAPAPSVATTVSVPVTVVDGPIKNAIVCLDKNGNGACDTGEPSATTDAAGKVTLSVDSADAGKYPVLAVVGTDAVDSETGKVPVPFTMSAPADKPSVVTPLTTLVQQVIASSGVSSAAAETQVKAQTGLNVSLFEDFSKSTTTDAKTAATVARMVVVTTQQQSSAISSTVGTKSDDGSTITKADVDKAVQARLTELLPALVSALADPAVQAATTPADKEAALLNKAKTIITDPDNKPLTATSVASTVAVNKQISSGSVAATTATPEAGATISSLTFTNATNWYRRIFSGTAAQNTPVDGKVKYRENRMAQSTGGNTYAWGAGSSPSRGSDTYWNGTAWAQCAVNFDNISTVRDANGGSTYNYCDNRETGYGTRAVVDVTGKPMQDVYKQINAAGYTNLYVFDATTVLGTATFPVGSTLFYQSSTAATTAPGYYPGTSNYVFETKADVAAGKTSATDTTSACAAITPSTSSSVYTTSTTSLDKLIAANKGTPCVFAASTVTVTTPAGTTATVASGTRNEWWSNSTLSVGTVGDATTGGNQSAYYTTNKLLRVGFGAGNVATLYKCQQRSTDGSTRNCDVIGSGTYKIDTLGDARVLSFSGLPANDLKYDRVFVERAGKVYYGYKDKPLTYKTARLNLKGMNALFAQLGMPAFDPNAPVTLTPASFVGNYKVNYTGTGDSGSVSCSFYDNGTTPACYTYSNVFTSVPSCTPVLTMSATVSQVANLSCISPVPAGGSVTTYTGSINYTTGVVSGAWSNTKVGDGTFIGGRQ